MKKNALFFACLAAVVACQSPQQEAASQQEAALEVTGSTAEVADLSLATAYGEKIVTAGAMPAADAPALLQGKDSLSLTLSASALESCTKKGCWMTVDLGSGESMRVTFKNYGFFVPKDLSGERVVMQGLLKKELTSVDELRHYAEDAGKSTAEIAAIQQPDTAYTFEAVGVLIWPKQQ